MLIINAGIKIYKDLKKTLEPVYFNINSMNINKIKQLMNTIVLFKKLFFCFNSKKAEIKAKIGIYAGNKILLINKGIISFFVSSLQISKFLTFSLKQFNRFTVEVSCNLGFVITVVLSFFKSIES